MNLELLTPSDASRRLGITPDTLRQWVKQGKVQAEYTLGGATNRHHRYRPEEIERVASLMKK